MNCQLLGLIPAILEKMAQVSRLRGLALQCLLAEPEADHFLQCLVWETSAYTIDAVAVVLPLLLENIVNPRMMFGLDYLDFRRPFHVVDSYFVLVVRGDDQ